MTFVPPAERADLEHEITSLRRRSTTLTIGRAVSYVAYAWVILSLTILAFGFVLSLFGANPDAALTDWVYRHLHDAMEPFRGIFPQQSEPSGSTLDVSVLFAMFVYGLLALSVRSLIDWLTHRRDRLERWIRLDQMVVERSRVRQARSAGHSLDGVPTPAAANRDPDARR